jgi:hypothetical protein
MEKYIAQNVMKLVKHAHIQEKPEIINVHNAKKVMSPVQECMMSAIKFVNQVNFIIIWIQEKENVLMNDRI